MIFFCGELEYGDVEKNNCRFVLSVQNKVVMVAVRWIGILLINALMILPSASSRNISENMKEYHGYAVVFALVSGILGLFVSYFVGIAAGPSIVIFASVIFFVTYILSKKGAK